MSGETSERCEICGVPFDPTARRPRPSPGTHYGYSCQGCYDAFNVAPQQAAKALADALYVRLRAQQFHLRRELDDLRSEVAALKGGGA